MFRMRAFALQVYLVEPWRACARAFAGEASESFCASCTNEGQCSILCSFCANGRQGFGNNLKELDWVRAPGEERGPAPAQPPPEEAPVRREAPPVPSHPEEPDIVRRYLVQCHGGGGSSFAE